MDEFWQQASQIAANEISLITCVGHTDGDDDDDEGACDGTDFGLLF